MQECEVLQDSKSCELSKSFLSGTLKEMMGCLKAECGSLFIFDPMTEELVLNNFYNSQPLPIKGLRRKIGQGICGKVIRLSEPVLVKDIDQDIRFRRNGFKHYRTGSFMSIPLIVRGSSFGLINVGDKTSGEQFSEQDLDYCVALASFACRIIESLLDSSRIRRENERLFKEKSLLEKYASVGKMASGIVHEIANPLDGVIRFANLLSGQMEKGLPASGYLSGIKSGLDRIKDITHSLCNFGRQFKTSSGQAGAKADVNRLLDESLYIFQDRISARIKLSRNYGKNLPLIADLGLQQVFINLIKNALDAMSGTGRLWIRTFLKKDFLEISIKDSGHGILPEVREHIFEPFFTTKCQETGAGLGLSICKEIVERYRGQINVQSLIGKGAEFLVSIPVARKKGVRKCGKKE